MSSANGSTPAGKAAPAPPEGAAAPAARDWRSDAAAAGGGAALLLGALVMVGWHVGSVLLTQVLPRFRPMVYLTASGFLLTGAALVALRLSLPWVARWCAGFIGLGALVRTTEYAFGFRSGLDDLAIGAGAREVQGAVAPLTAASFVLINAALLSATRRRENRRPVLEGLAGAIVFGIGGIGVIGYATGNPAYVWGPLTGMALHTAGGLVVLGICVLLLAWEGEGGLELPSWTPALVLIGCVAATVSLWRAVVSNEDTSFHVALRLHADSLAANAQAEFHEQVQVVDRFSRRVQSIPTMPRAAWEEDARFLLRQYPGIGQIAWTDDSLRTFWSTSEGGDLAETRRSRPEDIRLRELAGRALGSGSVALSGVFALSDGAARVAVCVPTARVGKVPGVTVAILRLDRLLDAIWSGEIAEGFSVSVSDAGREIYRRGRPPGLLPGSSFQQSLKLSGFDLKLRAWPSPILFRSRSRIPVVSLVLGLGVSVLLALLLHLAVRAKARAQQAEEASRETGRQSRERERTAVALVESEARFRAMSEASPVGMFLTDHLGGCSYVNRALVEFTGISAQENLGFGWTRRIHPEDRLRVQEEWRSAIERREPRAITYRFVHPDGRLLWLEGAAVPIHPEDPKSGYAGVLRDVTEARQSRSALEEQLRLAAFSAVVGEALTQAEELNAATQKCAEAIVSHLGGAMASIWVLPEGSDILHLSGSAWQGRRILPPVAQIPVGRFLVGRIASDRRPSIADFKGSGSGDDGDWATREGMVAFAGYPLVVGDRLIGVAAIYSARPLTESALGALASVADEMALGIDRFRGADKLRVSEARTRLVIDNMMGGLITTDGKGVIESVNPAAERTFGYRAEELVGKNLGVLLPPDQTRDTANFFREASKQALGRITEWDARRRNGEVFPIELALFQFQTPDGQWHLAGNVRDISERREVDRMKREFVSTVSHELRTPLTSIRGSLGLLAGGVLGELPSEARDAVVVAERNVERLMGLINDILDLDRFDSGRVELQRDAVPAESILSRSIAAVRAFADSESIRLDARESSATVWGDADRLVQVVVNLLSNAIKFSPAGSAVLVSADETAGQVEFRVADCGRGIPARLRGAVFERFRQVEASDSRRKGGTGLGLAICKGIVERHQGTIGVESEEGKGSTFWFRIDAAPRSAAPAGPAPPAARESA